jgi:hypothetical protein
VPQAQYYIPEPRSTTDRVWRLWTAILAALRWVMAMRRPPQPTLEELGLLEAAADTVITDYGGTPLPPGYADKLLAQLDTLDRRPSPPRTRVRARAHRARRARTAVVTAAPAGPPLASEPPGRDPRALAARRTP